jgi:ABC-type cobalamin/Fe3+-siderophores transport system ATPase subunit
MFKGFKVFKAISRLFVSVSWYHKFGFIVIPLLNTMLSSLLNDMVLNVKDYGILNILIIKFMCDFMGSIILMFYLYNFTYKHYHSLKLDFELSVLKCGVKLHGDNIESIENIKKDIYKLCDFINVIPLMFSVLSSFSVVLYKIGFDEKNRNTLISLIVLCMITFLLIYLNTNSKLYEKTEPDSINIYDFSDELKTKELMSMGLNLDIDFETKKRDDCEKQHNVHNFILIVLNLCAAYITLSNDSVSNYQTLTGITWLLGYLASSSKALFYHDFVLDLLDTIDMLKRFEYEHDDITVKMTNFKSVHFLNTSYGYYINNLNVNNEHKLVIRNLTYSFNKGILYYIESPNKSGKTSLLRMFSMNLMKGDIAFDTLNRKNVSFEDLHKNIYHVVQASENTNKFTRKELEYLHGKDLWLEKELKLENILGRGTEELNGGSKKRLFLYMALTSPCQIILLDEIMGELDVSDDETEGALIDTLNALIKWPKRNEKIILMIGHGLKKFIQNSESVKKLSVIQEEEGTYLVDK